MIQRFIGFWQSLNHLFIWLDDLIIEVQAFVPANVRLALGAFSLCALVLVVFKFISVVVDFFKAVWTSIIGIFGPISL